MNLKKTFHIFISKFFWKNVAVAVAISFFIALSVFLSLRFITHHGEAIPVPNVVGLYEEEASVLFSKLGIVGEVIDTVYMRGMKPGEIIEQNPSANSTVKKGRHVYLIINSRQPRMIPVPDLRDVSYRQGKATLEAVGFVVAEVRYVPSEFDGLIRDIICDGKLLEVGSRLPDASEVVLVVGTANNTEMKSIPPLKGLSYADAVRFVEKVGFIVGDVVYDVPPINETDKSTYVVYRQDPVEDTWTVEGRRVDIWLTQDVKKVEMQVEEKNTEEFF